MIHANIAMNFLSQFTQVSAIELEHIVDQKGRSNLFADYELWVRQSWSSMLEAWMSNLQNGWRNSGNQNQISYGAMGSWIICGILWLSNGTVQVRCSFKSMIDYSIIRVLWKSYGQVKTLEVISEIVLGLTFPEKREPEMQGRFRIVGLSCRPSYRCL